MLFKQSILSITLILGCILNMNAQLTVTSAQQSGNWADYYVQDVLLGSGVVAFNASFSTDSLQIGEFTSTNTTVNMADGLIMSSGSVLYAPGPNTGSSTGLSVGAPGDPDLVILGGNTSFDAAILEFDFIPSGDTVRFNYVFGSDEYNEFVNAGVNDAFGFFLSGPGISGGQGYVNDAVNIALIPGTSTGVSINTVNLGSNSPYYINNDQLNTGTIEYDGLTVKLQAVYPVNCTDTYHIKLAIGDGGDAIYDSGVFLEGGSFGSNLIEVNIASVNGDSTINEGCGEAAILFSRSDTSDTSRTYIQYSGTATNGVDFDQMPDTIVLIPGVFDTTIVINPYFDNIAEGMEYITISAITITSCNDTFISEGTLYIYDVPDFSLLTTPDTAFDCPISILDVSSVAQGGGPPPFTYQWNTGQTGDSITVNISSGAGVDTFAVEVFDSCGLFANVDTILVFKNYAPAPLVNILNDSNVNCAGDELELVVNDSLGTPPFSYLWSTGDTSATTNLEVNGPITIYVTITDQCGVIAIDSALLDVKKSLNFKINGPDSLRYCLGSNISLNVLADGAVSPYTYSWDFTDPEFIYTNTQVYTVQGDTLVRAWAKDACGRIVSKDIFIEAVKTEALEVIVPDVVAECPGDQLSLSALVSGGLRPYKYYWFNSDTDSVSLSIVQETTPFDLLVTDFCNNRDSASGLLVVNEYAPLEIDPSGDGRVCMGDEYVIELLGYGGAGDYVFNWDWRQDPLKNETFEESDNGLYSVISYESNVHFFTMTDRCGNSITDSVRIDVDHCLNIPNVLSPNGDGMNDAFRINNILSFPDARLTIYNRWGIKVWDSQPYLNDWVPLNEPSGTYFYILTSDYFPQMRGDITLFHDN